MAGGLNSSLLTIKPLLLSIVIGFALTSQPPLKQFVAVSLFGFRLAIPAMRAALRLSQNPHRCQQALLA